MRWSRKLMSPFARSAPAGRVVAATGAGVVVHPQEVVLDVEASDGAAVLNAAAAYVGRGHGLDPAPIARALRRREEAASTALGHAVAVPHARVAGIAQPLTLFLRTRHPVPFGAPDGREVSNFFVIIVPADGDAERHLELLANVASAFGERSFRTELAEAATAHQVDEAFGRRFPPVVHS